MLKNKTALITGSTSGIGLACARAIAAQGANVVLNGLGVLEEIEKLRQGIEAEHRVKCMYYPANMMQAVEIKNMISDISDNLGGLDILINNAGIQHVAPVDEFPEDKWNAIIAVNLTSSFITTRYALPLMKKAGWGRIINVASAHALVASPYKSAYVAAKHGIAGFTKTVALETAQQNITVNAVCPGYVWTPMVEKQIPLTMKSRNMTEEEVKRDVLLAAQPTKKFVTVDEVASLVVYLCNDSAASITGAVLPMEGGWTAGRL